MKLLFALITLLMTQNVLAGTSCYKIQISQSPAMKKSPAHELQTWCYQDVQSAHGAKVIFNPENLRAELAAVVTSDGVATHGSLIKGNVTAHRVFASDLNPLPVSLTEPKSLLPLTSSEVKIDQSKVNKLIQFLSGSRDDAPSVAVQEGSYSASVPQQNLPWRGYWWSYKLNLLAGSWNSPLAKYDQYVQSRTGSNPGAQGWENYYHAYKGIDWEGHCNGWAASAILRAEPNTDKIFPQNNLIFTIADQKGILAEQDYCAATAFYGKRNYGNPDDDPSDIYPADFHKVITYYIGKLGKVVAADYMSSPAVDNHLISGYSMTVTKTGDSTYHVLANLTFHKYDATPYLAPGTAPTYIRTYEYTLVVDQQGVPVDGIWLSANPDFLWVPLAPSKCSENNQQLSEQYTSEILSLPSVDQ